MSVKQIMGKSSANSLFYDQNLPPFLARLQSQYDANNRDGPDPILAAQRRSAKKRSASEEAEDRPLILDDSGEIMTGVTFGREGQTTLEEVVQKKVEGCFVGNGDSYARATEVSLGRKKKLGRIIREDSDGNSDEGHNDEQNANRRKRKCTVDGDLQAAAMELTNNKCNKDRRRNTASGDKIKKQKTRRKVQLSFEGDED
ncbi:hypothetical protein SEPCBS119000_006672 [Sporothrix epigloea]|uniref:DUF4604 domain-containing protein n=1 Tax=Sporothrix epigloea TaxID=1892477 RepID=A0ABP0E6V2_9PEZI